MPKFKLSCTDEDGTKITKKFESIFLQQTVENIADFLRGSGYVFDEIVVQNYTEEVTEDGEDSGPFYLAEELLCDH